jgi:hypothetical protein
MQPVMPATVVISRLRSQIGVSTFGA